MLPSRRSIPGGASSKRALPLCLQLSCPVHSIGGKRVSCLVESSSDCLPREMPALRERGGQAGFEVRLHRQTPKSCRSCAVADDAEVVANHPGGPVVRSEVLQ